MPSPILFPEARAPPVLRCRVVPAALAPPVQPLPPPPAPRRLIAAPLPGADLLRLRPAPPVPAAPFAIRRPPLCPPRPRRRRPAGCRHTPPGETVGRRRSAGMALAPTPRRRRRRRAVGSGLRNIGSPIPPYPSRTAVAALAPLVRRRPAGPRLVRGRSAGPTGHSHAAATPRAPRRNQPPLPPAPTLPRVAAEPPCGVARTVSPWFQHHLPAGPRCPDRGHSAPTARCTGLASTRRSAVAEQIPPAPAGPRSPGAPLCRSINGSPQDIGWGP